MRTEYDVERLTAKMAALRRAIEADAISLFAQECDAIDAEFDRLSARNPQGEKVQITDNEWFNRDEPSELRPDNATTYGKAERSDGRIQAIIEPNPDAEYHGWATPNGFLLATGHTDGECERCTKMAERLKRDMQRNAEAYGNKAAANVALYCDSGEQSETRIQGEDERGRRAVSFAAKLLRCSEEDIVRVMLRGTSVERSEIGCSHEPPCEGDTECTGKERRAALP